MSLFPVAFWLFPPMFSLCCFCLFSSRITAPEETTFHLLHLSLMREYIDYEFSALKVRDTPTLTRRSEPSQWCDKTSQAPCGNDRNVWQLTSNLHLLCLFWVFLFSESHWFWLRLGANNRRLDFNGVPCGKRLHSSPSSSSHQSWCSATAVQDLHQCSAQSGGWEALTSTLTYTFSCDRLF